MGDEHMEIGKEWLFKRNRNGDEHVKKCGDGYCAPKGRNMLEIHHILCVHACSDDTFPDDITDDEKKFIYACFIISNWNINDGDNNIGLPKKWAYVLDSKNLTGWGMLPCHQVDHDIYLTEVENYVRDKIWDQVKKGKKAEACKEFKGDNIVEYFKNGSAKWKGDLKARGVLYGGTKACLDYALNGTKGLMDDSNWYIPFSMAVPDTGLARPRAKPKKLVRLGLLIQAIV